MTPPLVFAPGVKGTFPLETSIDGLATPTQPFPDVELQSFHVLGGKVLDQFFDLVVPWVFPEGSIWPPRGLRSGHIPRFHVTSPDGISSTVCWTTSLIVESAVLVNAKRIRSVTMQSHRGRDPERVSLRGAQSGTGVPPVMTGKPAPDPDPGMPVPLAISLHVLRLLRCARNDMLPRSLCRSRVNAYSDGSFQRNWLRIYYHLV